MRKLYYAIIPTFNLRIIYFIIDLNLKFNFFLMALYYIGFSIISLISLYFYCCLTCAEPLACLHDGHTLANSLCIHDWRPIQDGETCTCCICGDPNPDLGCKEGDCDCAIHDACDN